MLEIDRWQAHQTIQRLTWLSDESDGTEVRELNVRRLLSLAGVVGHEHILFACSIGQNIMLCTLDGVCQSEEFCIAVEAANAHDFTNEMPDWYGTVVVERWTQLDGLQQQTLIARELIRQQKALPIAEATPVLDVENESLVHAVLDSV